jgi:acetolactate synthase-1/2/3 large subunit
VIGIDRPDELDGGRRKAEFVSDLVADLLGELGVRYLAITPGSSFRGLHDSIVNYGGNADPQIVLCLHEEIAVAAAHAYAKATGSVGVAAVHDLVGLMHATMAVYDAWCDGSPVLLLGGGGPADAAVRRGIDWIHSASSQASLVRDYVKWDDEPMSAQALVRAVARGHQLAAAAPAGPVYVTLDMELQERPLTTPVELPSNAAWRALPVIAAPEGTVERAADLLWQAERPVVVAGTMAFDPSATGDLVGLAELLGAACLDDTNAVAFPTAHPLNLSGDADSLRAADAVLAVDVRDTAALRAQCAPDTALIDVSLRQLRLRGWSHVGGAAAETTVDITAEPREGTRQLLATLRRRAREEADRGPRDARRRELEHRHTALRVRQQEELRLRWDDVPISPERLVAEVWNAVQDRDWLLTLRNTRSWLDGTWNFAGAGQWLGHSGGGGVGYGPGAIVGGAFAARDRGQTAVAIVGDGDLQMGVAALWTLVHYRIPTLIVVNNNCSFFNDEQHQESVAVARGRPPANAWIGVRMTDPETDFAALARAYGAWAEGPVVEPDALGDALRAALDHVDRGEVAVVDVRTGTKE